MYVNVSTRLLFVAEQQVGIVRVVNQHRKVKIAAGVEVFYKIKSLGHLAVTLPTLGTQYAR
jgi:hypothetical protein